MVANSTIEHTGIVQNISDNSAQVLIVVKGACASCNVQSVCNPSEMQEKIIEVKLLEKKFSVGDIVCVSLQERDGIKALFWAYILPFLLLASSFFILSMNTTNEAIIGLGALSILLPYYFILFLLKERMKRQFNFFIK